MNDIPIGMEEIVLTDGPRVRIVSMNWPVIAEVNREPVDVSGRMLWSMTVRQHHDGRALVLGKWWRLSPESQELAAGELVPYDRVAREIVYAIRRVANDLDGRVPGMWEGCFWQMVAELIAKLPPVDLT